MRRSLNKLQNHKDLWGWSKVSENFKATTDMYYSFNYDKTRVLLFPDKDKQPTKASVSLRVTIRKVDGIHDITSITSAGYEVMQLLGVFCPEVLQEIKDYGIRYHYKKSIINYTHQ